MEDEWLDDYGWDTYDDYDDYDARDWDEEDYWASYVDDDEPEYDPELDTPGDV